MTSKEVVTTPSVIDVFGKNLKFYRKKKQLTIADLANKLNIGKSTISSWENGKHSPDIEMINTIADILNVSVDTLLGRNKNKNKNKNIRIINGSNSIDTTTDYLYHILDRLNLSNIDDITDIKITFELTKK